MEIISEGLVGGQKYFVVVGPGYSPVHFIQRKQAPVAPGLPAEEQPPMFLQLALLDDKDQPINTTLVHPGSVRFFDDELGACRLATEIAYMMFSTLRTRLDELNNVKSIILPGGQVGPAPARMIIKP